MHKPLHQFYIAALLSFFPLALPGQTTQLSGGQTRILTNVQSGTAYTILASDCGKLISFSNSSSVAVSLLQAGPAGIAAGCWMDVQNLGPGTVTLTPVTSLIDQAASLQLTTNQGVRLVSSGAAYLTQRGQGSGTGAGGSGSVTNTGGTLVPAAIVTGNGGTDIKTPVPAATMDSKGNISIPGTLTTNTACAGCAGAIDLPQGSDPGATQTPNSFSWMAPLTIGTAYRWKVPSTDAAGAVVSDGNATPGTLSIVPIATSSVSNALVKTGSGGLIDPSFLPAKKAVPLLGYEVGAENGASAIATADLTNHSIKINNAEAKTLTEASCISDAGSQSVTVKIGSTTLFTIACVAYGSYSRAASDGSTGYLLATSMGSTAVGVGAQFDLSGVANGTTKDIKLSVWATVN